MTMVHVEILAVHRFCIQNYPDIWTDRDSCDDWRITYCRSWLRVLIQNPGTRHAYLYWQSRVYVGPQTLRPWLQAM